MKLHKYYICSMIIAALVGCNGNAPEQTHDEKKDSIEYIMPPDSVKLPDVALENKPLPKINDTLNDLAHLIAGNNASEKFFGEFRKKSSYTDFSGKFTKRWKDFDSTKLSPIKDFVSTEFATESKIKNLFYPFSGPDILYANTIFPEADVYTMIGLEPVGTLPIVDDKKIVADSIQKYVNKINSSLNAILRFSFFRTVSMKEDLRNDEVDGTIHLLLLFLNKTGHQIADVKPFYMSKRDSP